MPAAESVRPALERHLQSILDNDVAAYHASTVPELTLYEWYVTPHRIDGLPFHDFMMAESARPDTAATALDPKPAAKAPQAIRQRFDLTNYVEQRYGDTAICSYTLLLTKGTADGVHVRSHHETRVLVRLDGSWKVVHVHKSPAWAAPYGPADSPT
jgi:Calcium/calmodulin dependent protein kinase II association domain